jgi:hypothetical protein
MATETTSTDTDQSNSSLKDALKGPAEAVGVMALLGSLCVHYALGLVVLNETVGGAFEAAPEWLLIAINTLLGIPIVVAMVLTANWAAGWWDEQLADLRTLVIYAAAATTVGMPILYLVGVSGPL